MRAYRETPPDDVFRPTALSGRMWALLVSAYSSADPDVRMDELFAVVNREINYSVQEYLGYRFAGMNKTLERRGSGFRIKPGRTKRTYALTIEA